MYLSRKEEEGSSVLKIAWMCQYEDNFKKCKEILIPVDSKSIEKITTNRIKKKLLENRKGKKNNCICIF